MRNTNEMFEENGSGKIRVFISYQKSCVLLGLADAVEAALELEVALVLVSMS